MRPKTFRDKQRRREHCHLYRMESYAQSKRTQRRQAREQGKRAAGEGAA